jgi:hypothetical protein
VSLHAIGDCSAGRIEDFKLWQHLGRRIGQMDAGVDVAFKIEIRE